jgi:hypothetical protein
MSLFFALRVAFSTATTGTGSIGVGSRLGPSFLIPSETAIADGDTTRILVQEGDDMMIAKATYAAAGGGSFAINTVVESVVGGTVGTTQMSLAGAAGVRLLPPIPEDFNKNIVRTDRDQSSDLDSTARTQARANIKAEKLGVSVASNVQTASYTLALTDAGAPVRMNVGSANNLTVPPNSSVAFDVDTYVNLEQYGAGQTSIVAGAGVTIRSRNGLKLAGQYAVASLHKIGTDEWIACGDLTS